jgi:tyrosyl-tRNA synthetase
MSLDDHIAELTRGALEVIELSELRHKLERGTPLIVKFGADPTAPDLHLGHSVVLHAMRRYQDLGHRVQFLIGDFTGAIGDPSGRNAMRPQLSQKEIHAAADTYAQQVGKILRADTMEIVFNSTWFSTLSVADFIAVASRWTVARMLERDDFAKRYREHTPIGISELLYPLAQGYDSVAMHADVELGGSDQRFNLLVGRGLQRDYGQEPQVVMMMPLLVGTDGVEKMSKSKGNAIGIAEPPTAQVTKTMAVSDETMWKWYELISHRSAMELAQLRDEVASGKTPARSAKLSLAHEIATRFHGHVAATAAIDDYERKARGGEPDSMPEFHIPAGALVDALVAAQLAPSRSRAQRDIKAKAIAVNGVRAKEVTARLEPGIYVLRSGKNRFARVIVRGD